MFEGVRKAFRSFAEKIATKEISEDELENFLWELQLDLSSNNVAFEAAEYISERIKEVLIGFRVRRFLDLRDIIFKTARDTIYDLLSSAGEYDILKELKNVREKPYIILFVGVNGSGKTTTIAKIAYLLKKEGYSSVAACSDTFRAGAIEQLEKHAKAVGIRTIKHKYGASPAAVAYDAVKYAEAHGIDVVLIDTAGRMQTDIDLMEEMKKIYRVIEPHATIFIGDALAGNDAVDQAVKFNASIPLTSSILTKIDADEKGGAAISVVYATRKPISYFGIGQRYEDLIKADPRWIVKKVLP